MALTKVSTGMLSADVASIDLNIDANTMYIDVSNNRVGINNAAPSTALDVTGTVTADGLTVDGKASVNQNMTNGSVSAFTDPHLALKSTDSVDTTGFVGMSFATSDTANYGFSLGAQRTSGGQGSLVVRNHFNSAQGTKKLSVADNGDISFYNTAGTSQSLFWDASAESLGIGTSSPAAPLSFGANIPSDGQTIHTYQSGNSRSGFGVVAGAHRMFTNTSSVLSFGGVSESDGSTYTERMRIDGATGNVGIGVSAPNEKLESSGAIRVLGTTATSANSGTLSFNGTLFNIESRGPDVSNRGTIGFYQATSNGSSAIQSMLLDANGDLILGSTASLSGATITTVSSGNTHNAMRNSAATAGKFWRQEVDNANIFYIINNATTGVYMNDGGTTWVAISDETVKENIVEIEGALDKVMDYRCVEYNLIADENKAKKIGFIAQDWEVDYSPVVVTGADGKLGMQYTETIPVLLKAIQEQQAIIEALTARIAALES